MLMVAIQSNTKPEVQRDKIVIIFSFIDFYLSSSVLSFPLFSSSITVVNLLSSRSLCVLTSSVHAALILTYCTGSEGSSHIGRGSIGDASVQRFLVEHKK